MKLTNWHRDAIVREAVEKSFAQRFADRAQAEDVLAREAYGFVIPPHEQRLAAKLPENWLRRDACLRFNVEGQRIELDVLGGGLLVPYLPKGKEGGSPYGYNCNTLGAIPAGDLCDRIQAHALAGEKLKADRKAANSAVKAMVYSVTTIGKLREIWPEGEPFYGSIQSNAPTTLPAIQAAKVNSMLGLPLAA